MTATTPAQTEPKVGRIVHFKKVNHPGTKANRFVQESVYAAAP